MTLIELIHELQELIADGQSPDSTVLTTRMNGSNEPEMLTLLGVSTSESKVCLY